MFMTIGMALTTLSLLLTVLTLNIYHRCPDIPVPKLLRLLVLKGLGRLVCLPHSTKNKARHTSSNATPSKPDKRGQGAHTYFPSLSVGSTRRYRSCSGEDDVSVAGEECSSCQRQMPRNASFNVKVNAPQEDVFEGERARGDDVIELNEWHRLAAVLDRFFLVIYTSTVVAISVAMIVSICRNTTLPEALEVTASSS